MSREEWLAYFKSIGADYGMTWHLMAGLASLGLIRK